MGDIGEWDCHCGSGRKYKDCCSKLRKYRSKSDRNKFGEFRMNDMYFYEDNDKDMIHKMEYEIANFEGREIDKIRMKKELEKLKIDKRMKRKSKYKPLSSKHRKHSKIKQKLDDRDKYIEQLKESHFEEIKKMQKVIDK